MAPVCIAAFVLFAYPIALLAEPAQSADPPVAKPPQRIGDYGILSFTIHNDPGSITTIKEEKLSVIDAPTWFGVESDLSDLGPVDIAPGQSHSFKLTYQLRMGWSPNARATIRLRTTHSDRETIPAHYEWSISTKSGMRTYFAQCADDFGACGTVLADDTTPPESELQIYRPKKRAADGTVHIATTTPLLVTAIDPVVSSETTSGIARIGVGIDTHASSAFELEDSTNSFMLPMGRHRVQFASIDLAGNIEPIKEQEILVDLPAGDPPSDFRRRSSGR